MANSERTTLNSSKPHKRRLVRLNYNRDRVVEVLGRGRRAWLWLGGIDESRADYFGAVGSRRVIQLLKRAGLIMPEDVS